MAGNFELLSDQGLRSDGRRHGELRRIRCRLGVFGQADGSAYLEQVRLHYIKDSSFSNLFPKAQVTSYKLQHTLLYLVSQKDSFRRVVIADVT